jgi:hypothetical protein
MLRRVGPSAAAGEPAESTDSGQPAVVPPPDAYPPPTQLQRATDDGVLVKGYFEWSATDNTRNLSQGGRDYPAVYSLWGCRQQLGSNRRPDRPERAPTDSEGP